MRGLGYLISIVSVLLLGAVAWPKPGDPAWHMPAVLLGMALSIGGMGLRWLASRQQKHELNAVESRVGLIRPVK
ncbi:hypothetical protein [Sphingomonas humi]|uniref:Uncharacterized protein n=1 Tax=Sphingomonas humi TaxID=335630 RepID=A0ABP7S093_9SPHN